MILSFLVVIEQVVNELKEQVHLDPTFFQQTQSAAHFCLQQ